MKQHSRFPLPLAKARVNRTHCDWEALRRCANIDDGKVWHALPLRDTILHSIARISSRVFLGEELCRHEPWLRISREYASTMFPATDVLRQYPAGLIRSLAARLLPICRAAHAQVVEARSILQPVLEKRKAVKAAAAAAGKTIEFNDAIEWFENIAAKQKASYEPAAMQLFLSIVAIHTTSDLMTQIMTDLAAHQEVIEDLRKEIREVLSDGGWKKTTLTNMKLLDSVIKESQRLKPIQLGKPAVPQSHKKKDCRGVTVLKNSKNSHNAAKGERGSQAVQRYRDL